LAKSEQPLFGPFLGRERVPFRAPHGSEQHGVGRKARFARALRERPTARVDGSAANGTLDDAKLCVSSFQSKGEDAERLAANLGTDTVPGQCHDAMGPRAA
jgi:hypothetical protein